LRFSWLINEPWFYNGLGVETASMPLRYYYSSCFIIFTFFMQLSVLIFNVNLNEAMTLPRADAKPAK